MNRIVKHFIFWSLYFGIETLAYIENSSERFWIMTFVNLSIALSGFYLCNYFGKRLYTKLVGDSAQRKIIRYSEFWYIVSTVILFVCVRLITDLVIFNPNSGVPVFAYSIILLRIVLSFNLPGVLIGINSCKEKIISLLSRKQKQIEEENRLLVIEHNELSNEVTFLKVELIAAHEQLDSLGRKYIAKLKEYREMIRRMREDGDEWKDGLN